MYRTLYVNITMSLAVSITALSTLSPAAHAQAPSTPANMSITYEGQVPSPWPGTYDGNVDGAMKYIGIAQFVLDLFGQDINVWDGVSNEYAMRVTNYCDEFDDWGMYSYCVAPGVRTEGIWFEDWYPTVYPPRRNPDEPAQPGVPMPEFGRVLVMPSDYLKVSKVGSEETLAEFWFHPDYDVCDDSYSETGRTFEDPSCDDEGEISEPESSVTGAE